MHMEVYRGHMEVTHITPRIGMYKVIDQVANCSILVGTIND